MARNAYDEQAEGESEPAALTDALSRMLRGRETCLGALRELIEAAANDPRACREMWWCDADFADWPLGERAVVEALTRWVQGRGRLVMLASSFERIRQRQPRFVEWRRDWSHAVQCRAVAEEIDPSTVPALLLAPGLGSLAIADTVHWRARLSRDPREHRRLAEAIDALMQRSTESFGPTVLGL